MHSQVYVLEEFRFRLTEPVYVPIGAKKFEMGRVTHLGDRGDVKLFFVMGGCPIWRWTWTWRECGWRVRVRSMSAKLEKVLSVKIAHAEMDELLMGMEEKGDHRLCMFEPSIDLIVLSECSSVSISFDKLAMVKGYEKACAVMGALMWTGIIS